MAEEQIGDILNCVRAWEGGYPTGRRDRGPLTYRSSVSAYVIGQICYAVAADEL